MSLNFYDRNGVSLENLFEGVSWFPVSANYTLKSKDKVFADTSGGAFTVTLPANPVTGDNVEIIDVHGTFATNNLIVARNGERINSLLENLTCNIDSIRFFLIYVDSTIGWKLVN